ncbi:MAG: hypothetical protein WHS38_04335 [Thermodesulforhabdaceae bacterium]
MKAINHRITSASFILITGGSWLEALYAFLLGSIPDQIERIGSKRLMAHRSFSHDLGLWIGLILFVLFCPFSPPGLITIPSGYLKGIFSFRTWVLFLPGLLHCFFDMLTPKGVPFLGVRLSFPILNHGMWKEYLLSWSFLFVGVVAHAERFSHIVTALWRRIEFP